MSSKFLTERKFNIIIPSIEINDELLNSLKKIEELKYKNFEVTLVLDYETGRKLPKFKFKINKMIVGKINMSSKRNLAAKRFKSDFIAFLDSDAYPNSNWLKNANAYFFNNKDLILGGPSIPFPKQNYGEMLCHYCKRSFFLNGHLAYRKYLSKKKYTTDWLESCNLLLERNFYIKSGGQNKKFYIGEDQEYFKNLKRNKKSFKVLFSPKLFVYHKERKIKNFFLQRLSFGMNVFQGLDFSYGLKGLLVSLPLFTLFFFIGIFTFLISIKVKILILLFFITSVTFFIILDLKKYLNSLKDILIVTILLYLLNLTYAIGGILTIIGLRSIIEKKIYRMSRSTL